eukprot:1160494-Pelagomonas_calceolata.AAC.16
MSTAVAQLCRGVALKALCVSATAFELGPSRQDPAGFSSLVQLVKLVIAASMEQLRRLVSAQPPRYGMVVSCCRSAGVEQLRKLVTARMLELPSAYEAGHRFLASLSILMQGEEASLLFVCSTGRALCVQHMTAF